MTSLVSYIGPRCYLNQVLDDLIEQLVELLLLGDTLDEFGDVDLVHVEGVDPAVDVLEDLPEVEDCLTYNQPKTVLSRSIARCLRFFLLFFRVLGFGDSAVWPFPLDE